MSAPVSLEQRRVDTAAKEYHTAEAKLAAAEAQVALYQQFQADLEASSLSLPAPHVEKFQVLSGDLVVCRQHLESCRTEYNTAQASLADIIASVSRPATPHADSHGPPDLTTVMTELVNVFTRVQAQPGPPRHMFRAPEPTKPTFGGADPTKTKGFVEKAQAWLEVYVADGWFPAHADQVKALRGLLVDASPAELWSRTVSASTPDAWLAALSEFFAPPLEWETLSSNILNTKWRGNLRQLCTDVKQANLALEPPDRLSVKWLVAHILFRCPSALKPKVRSAVQGVTAEDLLWSQLANVAGLGGETMDSDGDTFMGAFGRGGRGGPPPRSGRGGGGKGGGGMRSRSDERGSGSTFRGPPQRQASQRGRCYAFLHQGRCMKKDCPYTHTRSPTPDRPNGSAPSQDRAAGGGSSSH